MVETSQANINELQPQSIDDIRQSKPLIKLSEVGYSQHKSLKKFLKETLYRHYRVHRMSLKASKIIMSLFEVFMDDIRVLPKDVQYRIDVETSHVSSSADKISTLLSK